MARKTSRQSRSTPKKKKKKQGNDQLRLIKRLLGLKPKSRARNSKSRSDEPLRLIKNLFFGWLFVLAKRHKAVRLVLLFGAIASFFIWSGINSLPPPQPQNSHPATLYANQCNDDLRKLFVSSIKEAEKSILLIIYSLNDDQVIKALQERAANGVAITVIHDPSTSSYGIKKLPNEIRRIAWKKSGLMHQKILVVDENKVWIGTANFTTESLRLHDNMVVGLCSKELAKAIVARKHQDVILGGQLVEFWILPEEKRDGLDRLIELVRSAKSSVKVAMFTWTHPDLTQAIVDAHRRGIDVEAVIDHGQGTGVCESNVGVLAKAGVRVGLSQTEMLHHKIAIIDDEVLVAGSANWTRAAFSKNEECFLVIHDLTDEQKSKMHSLWHAIRATRELINNDKIEILRRLKKAA